MSEFLSLIHKAFDKGVIKKIVFSRPTDSEIAKISGRLCEHRGERILSLEYSLVGNTVSHKNVKADALYDELTPLINSYRQVNLITTLGDAERKISKSGGEALLGVSSLSRRLSTDTPDFVLAVESLDKRKNYILDGNEDFLITLGVSDKNGRVHDKKQGKFRQINRFLEHINEIYSSLPKEEEIKIFDLCCGKSYLSFAVYHYLTKIKKRRVYMLGIDLKRDVISWCDGVARDLGYDGMHFICDNVNNAPRDITPDMVISLHACDIATDAVINLAIELGAGIVLSTPCCHRYLNDKIQQKALSFVTEFPQLRNKLCEALTDSIRIARLSAAGYKAVALELTDPENTPKNTLIRAIKEKCVSESELMARKEKYDSILEYLLGDGKDNYLSEV